MVPPAVFPPVDAALAVAYAVVPRRLGLTRDPAAAGLAGAGVGLSGSGAAPAQAAVEERAWTASSYLRGLDGEPSSLEFPLVRFDLIQVAYVVLAYLAFAGLAVALRRAGRLAPGVARLTTTAGGTMAALVVIGIALAPGGSGVDPQPVRTALALDVR